MRQLAIGQKHTLGERIAGEFSSDYLPRVREVYWLLDAELRASQSAPRLADMIRNGACDVADVNAILDHPLRFRRNHCVLDRQQFVDDLFRLRELSHGQAAF
jgi:hypothetical protein